MSDATDPASIKSFADGLLEKTLAENEVLGSQLAACIPYLKEGETPAERIAREIADSVAVLTLLAQARAARDRLAAELAEAQERAFARLKTINAACREADCDDSARLVESIAAIKQDRSLLMKRVDALAADSSAVRAALEWYANALEHSKSMGYRVYAQDGGKRARAALSAGPALSGMQVVIDPTMPEGTAELRCGDSRVPIVPSAGGPQS